MKSCQILVTAVLAALLAAQPAGAYSVGSDWDVQGSLSMNYRGLGPRRHATEVEIEDQLALTNVYYGVEGPGLSGIPMRVVLTLDEFGRPELHQATVATKKWSRRQLEAGKFIVPFGRYNPLYRPGDYLTVTRPLLYSDPRNLDSAFRINRARPIFSPGYSDLGIHYLHFVDRQLFFLPDKFHFWWTNGFGESPERGQVSPEPRLLGIPPDTPNGVDIDFEHRNQQLRDNNDDKSPGIRLEYDVGDFEIPLPLPEGEAELQGVNVGVSGMSGRYDIRDRLGYRIAGADAAFQYRDFAVAGEVAYSYSDFRSPIITSSSTIASSSSTVLTVDLPRRKEVNWGYYVQATFPVHLPKLLGVRGRTLGVLGYNWMQRRGPELEILNAFGEPNHAFVVNGEEFFQINALTGRRVVRRTEKYTAALNHRYSEFLSVKLEYSTWRFENANQLYQWAFATVLQF